MRLGRVSSAALMASGLAGVLAPRSVTSALEVEPVSARGTAESRAGLGGTYAALGGWALVRGEPSAQVAVGVTWLGAAAVRLASLLVDRPRTDWTYWSYLTAELVFGVTAISAASR